MAWQFGPYRVEELIARGGMGEVHRAYDDRHDRVVALKLLAEHAASDEEFRKRFKREAQMAARLREPHVIPIHAYGEIDGRLYLDMRLVEGLNVSKTLSEYGPMSPATAVDVISQIASALDAAHSEGLVHRDVKPSNVLLQDGFAYLVDFGIARPLTTNTDITGTDAAIGTIAYMAPERFTSMPVDHRVDVYALACVLFQCLTGSKPFTAENVLAVVFAHVNSEPPKPSERRPGIPAGLDRVIARGMAKDPAQRFASAGELASEARKALTTSTIPLPTVPPPMPAHRPPPQSPPQAPPQSPPPAGRRGPRWKVYGAVAALILAAGTATAIAWLNSTGSPSGNPPATTPTSAPPSATLAGLVNPPCNGSYIVIVDSAVNRAEYNADIKEFLDANPGAKYLHAPSTGCSSLRTHVNGAEIYAVYYGPFTDEKSACARKASAGGDSFVRRLDNTSSPERAVSCG